MVQEAEADWRESERKVSTVYRHIHLVGATSANLRTAEFAGVEHLVVPVVAMVEGVVWAINAPSAEFVPAEELAVTPQQWNGRQCFAGHPVEGKTQVTANTPTKLSEAFGIIFGASTESRILETRRLELEAWLDPIRAAKVGEEAMDVIRRLRAGERVEVSVGCYMSREETEGNYNGQPFNGIWRDIVSDHLAFLKAGEQGACSIEAGCGAPRVATRHLVTATGIIREDTMPGNVPVPGTPAPSTPPSTPAPSPTPAPSTPPSTPAPTPQPSTPAPRSASKNKSLRERIMEMFRAEKAVPGQSDRDLRRALDAALRAVEPGYMGIDDVYAAENVVIYSTNPTDEWKTMRRGFKASADGTIELEEAEQVEAVVSYEPVTAASAAPTSTCGCHGKGASVPAPAVAQSTGVSDMNQKVKALIDGSGGKFTEADAAWLATVPEDRLAALASTPTTETVAPPAPAQPVAATAKTVTEEEYLANAPESIRALVTRQKQADATKKANLVSVLKTCQSEYPEAELATMSVDQLERLDRVLGASRLTEVNGDLAVDFSARPVVRAAGENDPHLNPPDPYNAHIERINAARRVQ